RAPVGCPVLSARDSSCIQAAMSRRECSWACPWYWRSVTAVVIAFLLLPRRPLTPPSPLRGRGFRDPRPIPGARVPAPLSPLGRGRGERLLEQHGLDERLDLVARALEGPHLLLELDEEMRDPRALQPLLHQHVVEQGGLAELGRHEDDRVGPGPAHLLDQALGPMLAALVPGRRRDRLVHVGRAQALERVAVTHHVRREPAPAEQQIVLDYVAAGL